MKKTILLGHRYFHREKNFIVLCNEKKEKIGNLLNTTLRMGKYGAFVLSTNVL